MTVGCFPPLEVKSTDMHGQLLDVCAHLYSTDLDNSAYLEQTLDANGFRSWFLM